MTELAPQPHWAIGPTWQKTVDGAWHLPEKNRTLGDQVVNWIYEYVLQPSGPRAGEAFLPTAEQFRFLLWWYAIDDNGRFIYRSGLFRRMKGWGKDPLVAAMSLAELCGPVAFGGWNEDGSPIAVRRSSSWIQVAAVSQDQPLALDTEVPTPTGWTTIGDLAIGDYVIGSDSQPHEVKRQTEVFTDLDCYKITFDDGTSVVASASHGWTTERLNGHGDKYETVTQTTEQLAVTVRGSKNRKRHRVPVVGVDLPDRELKLDPWFLGLWLGDGSKTDPEVVFESELRAEYETLVKPLVADFQEVVWTDHVTDNGCWSTFRIKNKTRTRDNESYRSLLRQIGVFGDKHIPDEYMHAGTEQRRELLRGLMDSDGGIDKNGRAYFVNSNQRLVYQFQELATGLGFRCTVRTHGKDRALRAEFNPGDGFPIAKLAKKYSRQKPDGTLCRSRYRWIESVERVDSIPVKCIGIDTEDHLFQVTRSRILTHNTTNTFRLFPAMISSKMKAEFGLDVNKTIIYTNDGCLIEGLTSSPTSMEGKRPTFVILNEVQWWVETNQGHEMAGIIDGNVTKAAYGGCRSLAICNAHVPGQESVGEWYYDEWHAVQSGQAINTRVLYDALEAPADTPISEIPAPPKYDDPDYDELQAAHEAGIEALKAGIRIARGDSVWLDIDSIVDSILDIKNPISESRRKFLNHVNAAEDSWVSPQEWDLCFDPDLRPLEPGDKITLGFDGSKSSDHTALVACRVEDGALFVIKTWDPAKYGGEVPREDVDTWVDICFARYNPVAFRADVKEFESYVDSWSRKYKKKLIVNASPNNPVAFDMRGNQKRFALDCEKLYDSIVEQEVRHDGNKLLRAHVCNAHRHPTNYDAIAIRKASKDSSRKIDAAVCAVLAWGARQDYMMSKKMRTGRGAVLSAR